MEDKKDIFDYIKPGKIETPDQSYFEQLAKDVIASQPAQKAKVIPLYKKPVVWMSAAAAAIAVLIIFTYERPVESADVLLALNDIPTEELMMYVDENIDDFDTEMLLEIIPTQNIEEVTITEPELTEVEENDLTDENAINLDDIDAEDILEYLNDESINIYDLEDELNF